jgi:molecular chaperone GrpE
MNTESNNTPEDEVFSETPDLQLNPDASAPEPAKGSLDFSAAAEAAETGGEVTIESLQAQLADAEKRVLMAHADLDNFRRRTRRDTQDQLRYASIGLIGEVLESIDNLQRAVDTYEADPNNVDGLVEGVKIVSTQIATTLENHGCKKIEAVGQPFDPSLHQAVQMQASEEFESNVVMKDLRPGFQLHDRVVRPSQVFVSTGAEQK